MGKSGDRRNVSQFLGEWKLVNVPSVPGFSPNRQDLVITLAAAGDPSLHCTIPTEGAPSLRFLQGWAAMLPAQRLSVLHHPLCMPSSYPPFAYAKDGHPHL